MRARISAITVHAHAFPIQNRTDTHTRIRAHARRHTTRTCILSDSNHRAHHRVHPRALRTHAASRTPSRTTTTPAPRTPHTRTPVQRVVHAHSRTRIDTRIDTRTCTHMYAHAYTYTCKQERIHDTRTFAHTNGYTILAHVYVCEDKRGRARARLRIATCLHIKCAHARDHPRTYWHC